mgnify:CR=1 FL=1
MKILSAKPGLLQIEMEDKGDWHLFTSITGDAVSLDRKLSHWLGEHITDEEVTLDWLDYIVPELEDRFTEAVLHVTTAIASARVEFIDGPGVIQIRAEDSFLWYSTLNQARLALEERYQFGSGEDNDSEILPPNQKSAFLRSRFYCAIQSLILEHVME